MISFTSVRNRTGLTTRERIAWVLFDFGDQSFSTVVLGVVLPIYYVQTAGGYLPANQANVYYAYAIAVSFTIVAFSSPVLGAISDHVERSRAFLGSFTIVGVISTGLMFFASAGDLLLLSVLMITANVGFSGGRLFYNSLLPGITNEASVDRVSAAGYAMGYLGGVIILLVAIAFTFVPSAFGIPSTEAAARYSLFVSALWWAVFAIPLFLYVPEPDREDSDRAVIQSPVRAGFGRLRETYGEIRQYRVAFLFLIAFWFYSNGINGVIYLATVYAEGIGLSQGTVMVAFLVVHVIGVPCSLAFGQLAGYLTSKKAVYCGLLTYVAISLGLLFISQAWQFILGAAVIGMVQGGTQAISRSLFGSLIPKNKSSEFFSFFAIVLGFASILAPLLFGFFGQVTGSVRVAMSSLTVFFIVGLILLTRVDVETGRTVARKQTPKPTQSAERVSND
jgi:UMF1 family MFS transporter